jgi:hypothetical protein
MNDRNDTKMTTTNPSRRMWMAIAIVISVLASSCEKVIQLDLNNAEKKYVVEGILTDEAGSARVLITQTKDFDQDNTFPGISGATVTIAEAGGSTTTLNETSPGVYTAPALAGTAGKSYRLSVTVNGSNFVADCTMPAKVNFDTLFVTDELLFTETRKIANIGYQDPVGRGNNYRFVQYVNRLKENDLMIENDDYTDGRPVQRKLYFFADNDANKIQRNDTLRVDMQCIDPVMYKYWFSLDRSASGQSGQATPSNPVTNMKGGALGYFSAHTSQTRTLIVP